MRLTTGYATGRVAFYVFSALPPVLFVLGWLYEIYFKPVSNFPAVCMIIAAALGGGSIILGIRHIARARQEGQAIVALAVATFLGAFPFLTMILLFGYVLLRR